MSVFLAPAIQAKAVQLIAARPLLNGVQVTDGYAGDANAQPERIFTGDARSNNLTPAGLKAGRTFYQESGEFDIVIQVLGPDSTPAEVKSRVQELAIEVAECIADNRTLQSLAGLNYVVGARWDLSVRFGQTGSAAEVVYTVRYEARLT